MATLHTAGEERTAFRLQVVATYDQLVPGHCEVEENERVYKAGADKREDKVCRHHNSPAFQHEQLSRKRHQSGDQM